MATQGERKGPSWLRRARERWLALSPGTRTAVLLAGAAVLALGIGAGVGRVAEYGRVLDALREADLGWLPVCLAGEVLAYAGYILAFREAARVAGGPPLSLGLTTHVIFVSFGAFAVASAAGGLATDYWALREAGVGTHEGVRRVLGLNTLLYAVFAAGAWIAALALILGAGEGAPLAMTIPWLVLMPPCFLASAWVIRGPTSRHFSESREGGRIRRAFGDAVAGVALFREMVTTPAQHVGGLVGAAVYWTGDLLCLWAALRAFGVELSLAALVLAYATGYVANVLPLPAGGAGALDASLTFALTLVGAPLAAALLGAFTYRFFTYWLPLIPALAAVPTVPQLRRKLQAVRR